MAKSVCLYSDNSYYTIYIFGIKNLIVPLFREICIWYPYEDSELVRRKACGYGRSLVNLHSSQRHEDWKVRIVILQQNVITSAAKCNNYYILLHLLLHFAAVYPFCVTPLGGAPGRRFYVYLTQSN